MGTSRKIAIGIGILLASGIVWLDLPAESRSAKARQGPPYLGYSVIDANGEVIGEKDNVVDIEEGTGAIVAVAHERGTAHVRVRRNSIGGVVLSRAYFASDDCTGAPYISRPREAHRFLTDSAVAGPGATVYSPTSDVEDRVSVSSEIAPGEECTTIAGRVMDLVPAMAVYRFRPASPPFSLVPSSDLGGSRKTPTQQ